MWKTLTTTNNNNNNNNDNNNNPLGIVQDISIWPYEKMVYAQPKISPGEWHTQTPMRFWLIWRSVRLAEIKWSVWSLNLGQTNRPSYNQQRRRTCKIWNFAVSSDHGVNFKESEKKKKILRPKLRTGEKKAVEHKSDVYIVKGVFGTFTQGFLKGLEDLEIKRRMETILTLRKVLETWGNLLSLKHLWKTIS